MRVAFCLFHYFPYGGLQRDFLRIARLMASRQHEVHIYTMQWEGSDGHAWHIHLIKPRGLQNHTRCRSFAKQVLVQLKKESYDAVIGFNKMPGLDWYYAADTCYQHRARTERSKWYRLLPRYRALLALERAVFQKEKATRILLISPKEKEIFQEIYQTPNERFEILPPGIARDTLSLSQRKQIRKEMREQYRIEEQDFLLLLVGSRFKTKGLDRALSSIASLPKTLQAHTHLFVIGDDCQKPYIALAKKLGLTANIQYLGGRSDVPHFLMAGDLLLHPAYHENTGTVLLEALVYGLPVLSLAHCGYAHYVETAKAGMILPHPFSQSTLNHALLSVLTSAAMRQTWSTNAIAFSQTANIYQLVEQAVTLIEKTPQVKQYAIS